MFAGEIFTIPDEGETRVVMRDGVAVVQEYDWIPGDGDFERLAWVTVCRADERDFYNV